MTYARYFTLPSIVLIVLHLFGVPVTSIYVVTGLPLLITAMLIFGRLIDNKMGLFSAEAARHSYLNPYNQEVLETLKELKETVKEIQEEQVRTRAALLNQGPDKRISEIHSVLNAQNDKLTRVIRLLQK